MHGLRQISRRSRRGGCSVKVREPGQGDEVIPADSADTCCVDEAEGVDAKIGLRPVADRGRLRIGQEGAGRRVVGGKYGQCRRIGYGLQEREELLRRARREAVKGVRDNVRALAAAEHEFDRQAAGARGGVAVWHARHCRKI